MRRFIFLSLLLLATVLSSTVNIADGAEVSGLWSANESPYIIAREATIPVGQTLTLEPGVEIWLQTGNQDADKARLIVQGTISAVGTEEEPIVFTRSGSGSWGAIVLQDSDSENNQFIYCQFDYANRYNDGSENIYGALALYGSHAAVMNCQFNSNSRYGIAVREYSDPLIENCEFDGNGWSGIYIRESSEPQIIDCVISNNSDYGVYVREGGIVEMEGCTVQGNGLAGIYAIESSNITVTDCISTGNTGSGVYTETSTITLTDCNITDNTLGGVYLYDESSAVISNCSITENGNSGQGPGHNSVDGIYCDTSQIQVTSCEVSGNSSDGIAIYDDYGALVQDCDISDNSGFGVWLSFTADTDVSGNTIYLNGDSGIYSGENGTPYIHENEIYENDGSGIETYRSTTASVNNDIHDNAGHGIEFYCWDDGSSTGDRLWNNGDSEIYIHYHSFISLTNNSLYNAVQTGVELDTTVSATVCNCIFHNEVSIVKEDDCEANVSYSLFTGEFPESVTDDGGNLVNADPLYVNPSSGDLHLQEDSPCIDTGNPDMSYFTLPVTDPDGYPRIWPECIDMGVYERYTNLAPVISGWEPLDNDFYVDAGTSMDFIVHASDWEPVSFLWQLNGETIAAGDSTCSATFQDGFYILLVTVSDGSLQAQTRWNVHVNVVSADDDPEPTALSLTVGVNPARPPITLRYSLPNCTNVRIELYDIRGRFVRGWNVNHCESGEHELLWDGRDADGQTVASGVYLTRLQTGSATLHTKFLLLK